MREKRILMLTLLLFLTMFFVSFGEVQASDWELEDTDVSLVVGNWYSISDPFSTSDVFSGFFETHVDTMGLDFFICDSTNFALWESTGSATVYDQVTNYHYKGWEFTIPYSDTWYVVISNRYGSSTVTFDVGADSAGDNSPYYDPASWDHTEYAIHLEPDEYYSLSTVYGTGSTISGHVSTWFSSDGIDVFFCDEANYNTFTTGGNPTVYGLREDYHQTNFGEFTVPYDGTWYVVFSAEGQADTVTISLGMDYTVLATGATTTAPPSESTSTESTTTTSEQVTTSESSTEPTESTSTTFYVQQMGSWPLLLGGAILGLIIIGAVVCTRRGRSGPPPSPGGFEVITPPPGPSTPRPEPAHDTTPIGAKVLVICPYCGSKNEQGILKCQKCGADL